MELKIKIDFDHGDDKLLGIALEKGLEYLSSIHKQINLLTTKFEKAMAVNDDKLKAISDQMDAVSGKLDTQNAGITAAKKSLDGIKTDVGDLKTQIANSGLAGAALDELKQKAQNISDKVDAGSAALADLGKEASDLDDETTQDTTPPDTGGGTTTPPDGGGTTPPDTGTTPPDTGTTPPDGGTPPDTGIGTQP